MSTKHGGIVIADRGAAIVGIERGADGALLVIRIERLPADISAVIARLEDLEDDVYVTVDADGLGNALWAALEPPDEEHWQLYTGRGIERQQLVDRLLVAIHQDVFRFASGLAEQEAMSKALVSCRRAVKEDGLIGSELVVALLLALVPPADEEAVLVAWGPSPFADSEPDYANGAIVGGLRLVRAPDGTLVGLTVPKDPER
jgi:hypothetical protein